MTLLAHHHARRLLASQTGPPQLIWQEDNPAIAYGGGSWVPFYYAPLYNGAGKYAIENGAAFAFLVPAGGYSRCILEAYADENGAEFLVYRNNELVLVGNSFTTPGRQRVLAEIACAAGDHIQVTFNGQGTNQYGNGGNNAFYADQIRFT